MKPYYRLFEIGKARFIIRNAWSDGHNGDFPIIAIVNDKMRDRNEFKIGLFGIYFVYMKNFK